jgi:uncharacterized iron-regulated membrane protein
VAVIGLLASSMWGYVMWWQRRPRHPGFRLGRAPRRGAWRAAPRGKLAFGAVVTIGLMWLMPVFGISLLVFLVVDAARGWRDRHPAQLREFDAELHDSSGLSR